MTTSLQVVDGQSASEATGHSLNSKDKGKSMMGQNAGNFDPLGNAELSNYVEGGMVDDEYSIEAIKGTRNGRSVSREAPRYLSRHS